MVSLKIHSKGDFVRALLKEAGLLHNFMAWIQLVPDRYTFIIKRFLSCCSFKKRNV